MLVCEAYLTPSKETGAETSGCSLAVRAKTDGFAAGTLCALVSFWLVAHFTIFITRQARLVNVQNGRAGSTSL